MSISASRHVRGSLFSASRAAYAASGRAYLLCGSEPCNRWRRTGERAGEGRERRGRRRRGAVRVCIVSDAPCVRGATVGVGWQDGGTDVSKTCPSAASCSAAPRRVGHVGPDRDNGNGGAAGCSAGAAVAADSGRSSRRLHGHTAHYSNVSPPRRRDRT